MKKEKALLISQPGMIKEEEVPLRIDDLVVPHSVQPFFRDRARVDLLPQKQLLISRSDDQNLAATDRGP